MATENKSNVKRERFIRIVERRVNVILSYLDNLGKCSNRRNYIYSEEDVKKIFSEIDKKIKDVKNKFQDQSDSKSAFKLEK